MQFMGRGKVTRPEDEWRKKLLVSFLLILDEWTTVKFEHCS